MATKEINIVVPQIVWKPHNLPKSWLNAAGALRSKKKDLLKHLQVLRHEWDKRG